MPLSSVTHMQKRAGVDFAHPQKGGTTIYRGAIVVLNADGFAIPGKTATGLVSAGIAQATSDNSSGADSAKSASVSKGVFLVKSGDITRQHIGDPAYIVDDEFVSFSHDTNSRSVAGTIVDVDQNGVWVAFV